MDIAINTVTIVGVGLLGGSLGLALKQRGLVDNVRGVGHRPSTLDTALSIGAIDKAYMDLREACIGSDLIVLCTPAALVPQFLDEIRPVCAKHAVVTDVASTKATICAHARETWSHPLRFIGSHPMAGSEKYGPEHSDPDLYEDAVTFVERSDDADQEAELVVIELWKSVGSSVVGMTPETHDKLVARTSHVPHIMSSALAQLADVGREVRPFIGNGFRDVTRVAEGRPEIWRDICLTNGVAISLGLHQIASQLQEVAKAISDEDGEALDAFFFDGQEARRRVLDK